MKKGLILLIALLLLALSISTPAYASGSDFSSSSPQSSLQLMFAHLQLEQAEIAKKQALDRMEQIEKIQQEQREVAGYISEARKAQSEAENNDTESEIPSSMAEYLKNNGISYGENEGDTQMSAEEWASVNASLTNRLEQLGAETQQQMLQTQTLMQQYNSYLIGAENQQLITSNQTISSLARGQSMYGDSEAGLALTALAVGLVLGCLVTVSVQKIRRKAEKA